MTELVDTGLSRAVAGRGDHATDQDRRVDRRRGGRRSRRAASGLASGSMSEEFSGQMTTIGCGARPARTSSDSRSVSRTWLSSTARRWALNSSPSRGTLPCTAATVIDGSSPAPTPDCRTWRDRQRGAQQHDADAHAGQHHRGRRCGLAVVAAPPPLHDLERHCGQAESDQRHRERHQRRTADWASASNGPSV